MPWNIPTSKARLEVLQENECRGNRTHALSEPDFDKSIGGAANCPSKFTALVKEKKIKTFGYKLLSQFPLQVFFSSKGAFGRALPKRLHR